MNQIHEDSNIGLTTACDGYCVETNPEFLKLWPNSGCDHIAVTWRYGKNLCAKCDERMRHTMECFNYMTA